MPDEKTPLQQAVDLLVYAPVGLALTAAEELPGLVEKGRARVTGQLAMAKMVGQFAVSFGQKEAERRVRDAVSTLERTVGGRTPEAPNPATTAASTPSTAASPAGEAATATADTDGHGAGNGKAASAAGTARQAPKKAPGKRASGSSGAPAAGSNGVAAGSRGDASHLAIPAYDTLAASQVVQRLEGLSADELEAVRAYESETRGRRTILNKVAQLQAGTP